MLASLDRCGAALVPMYSAHAFQLRLFVFRYLAYDRHTRIDEFLDVLARDVELWRRELRKDVVIALGS